MRITIRRLGAAPLIAIAAVAVLAGCGPGPTGGTGAAPPAQYVHGNVVLTPVGVSRIGLQTATATAAGRKTVVPQGALVYEASGQTAVYTQTSPLIYTIRFITVASINGNQVVVSQGLSPGTVVVTQGAEELLGVQNGVGVET